MRSIYLYEITFRANSCGKSTVRDTLSTVERSRCRDYDQKYDIFAHKAEKSPRYGTVRASNAVLAEPVVWETVIKFSSWACKVLRRVSRSAPLPEIARGYTRDASFSVYGLIGAIYLRNCRTLGNLKCRRQPINASSSSKMRNLPLSFGTRPIETPISADRWSLPIATSAITVGVDKTLRVVLATLIYHVKRYVSIHVVNFDIKFKHTFVQPSQPFTV